MIGEAYFQGNDTGGMKMIRSGLFDFFSDVGVFEALETQLIVGNVSRNK